MDWSSHFPAFISRDNDNDSNDAPAKPLMTKEVEIADIGCGFGGLIVALSPLYPETLMLGTSYLSIHQLLITLLLLLPKLPRYPSHSSTHSGQNRTNCHR